MSVTIFDLDGIPHAVIDPAETEASYRWLRDRYLEPALKVGTFHGFDLVELVDVNEWEAYSREWGLEPSRRCAETVVAVA